MPYGYRGLKIFTSLSLRFQDFQRKHSAVNNTAGNTRNGKSTKTLKGDFGALPIEIPRDRHGSFEPQLIPKHQRAAVLEYRATDQRRSIVHN